MAQKIIKWACPICGTNNLVVESGNIQCSVCNTPQDPAKTEEAVVGPFIYVPGYWEDLFPEDEGQWNTKLAPKIYTGARRGSEPGLYYLFNDKEEKKEYSAKILKRFSLIISDKKANTSGPSLMERLLASNHRLGLWQEDGEHLQMDYNRVNELKMKFRGAVTILGRRGYCFRNLAGEDKFYTSWMCVALGILVEK